MSRDHVLGEVDGRADVEVDRSGARPRGRCPWRTRRPRRCPALSADGVDAADRRLDPLVELVDTRRRRREIEPVHSTLAVSRPSSRATGSISGVLGGDQEVEAVVGELLGELEADPARRSGHDRNGGRCCVSIAAPSTDGRPQLADRPGAQTRPGANPIPPSGSAVGDHRGRVRDGRELAVQVGGSDTCERSADDLAVGPGRSKV